MAFYTDSNGVVHNDNTNYGEQKQVYNSQAVSIAKVFGYMFAGLLITAVVAFIVGFIFALWMQQDLQTATSTLFFVMIGSSILCVILSFLMNFLLRKNSKMAMMIPAIIYATLVGFMLSSFTIFVDWWLLAGTFLITSVIFGLMSLIALMAKRMKAIYILGIGLILGGGILSLFNLLFMLIFPSTFETFYWIVSLVIFAGVMFVSIYDIHRLKLIAEAGQLNGNIALYCAFNLYVDFIYIFVRILSFIISVKDR